LYGFQSRAENFLKMYRVLEGLLEKTDPGCHILWNYAPGILGKDGFGLRNTERLTGFSLAEQQDSDSCYPVLCVKDGQDRRQAQGHTYIMNADPKAMTPERMQQLLRDAGVHIYAPAYCVVHTDSRFLYLLAEKTMQADITLQEKMTCRELFSGQIYEYTDKITLNMEAGTCVFLEYGKEGEAWKNA